MFHLFDFESTHVVNHSKIWFNRGSTYLHMPVLSHLKIGQIWPQEVGSVPKFSFWRFFLSWLQFFFINLLFVFLTSSFNSLNFKLWSTICISVYFLKSLWSAHTLFGLFERFSGLWEVGLSRKVEKVSLWSSVWTQTRNTKGKGGSRELALGGWSLVLTRTTTI